MTNDKRCKDSFKAIAIYYINPKDIKSYDPLVMKRKYGKFDRIIYKEKL